MSESERVVVENYPARNLPADVRCRINPSHHVRVTVEDQISPSEETWDSLTEKIAQYHRDNPGSGVTSEEAVARVRAIRDEWD